MREIDVRAVREAAREVDYVASTDKVDSYGEVLRQNWIFDRYKRNPVILWAHNNDWAVPTLPVGRAVKFGVDKGELLITPKFSVKNPFALIVFDMIVEGMLRAGSVGFKPHKVSRETIDGAERIVCDQNELYEFSICPMGANADALVIESTEERMAKMIEERSKHAVRSFPPAQSSTQTTPAPAGNKGKTMKTRKLTPEQANDIRGRGVIVLECEDCKAPTIFDMPEMKQLCDEREKAVAQAASADERAKTAEAARRDAESRVTAAEERAKTADADRAKAVADREAATSLAETEKARADKATEEKAAIELAPLVGMGAWQLSPAQAKRLVARAATDPAGYAADVADVRAKGIAAGDIKSDQMARVAETATADTTPRVTELDADSGTPDQNLLAEMDKRARHTVLASAANAIPSPV